MRITQKRVDEIAYTAIGCAIEVHKELGPGLLESIYERCFKKELSLAGISFLSQQNIPIKYKGFELSANLRYDVLAESLVLIELKSHENLLPVHDAVLMTYMKLLEIPKGILINFNCNNIVRGGQKTFVNQYYSLLPKS